MEHYKSNPLYQLQKSCTSAMKAISNLESGNFRLERLSAPYNMIHDPCEGEIASLSTSLNVSQTLNPYVRKVEDTDELQANNSLPVSQSAPKKRIPLPKQSKEIINPDTTHVSNMEIDKKEFTKEDYQNVYRRLETFKGTIEVPNTGTVDPFAKEVTASTGKQIKSNKISPEIAASTLKKKFSSDITSSAWNTPVAPIRVDEEHNKRGLTNTIPTTGTATNRSGNRQASETNSATTSTRFIPSQITDKPKVFPKGKGTNLHKPYKEMQEFLDANMSVNKVNTDTSGLIQKPLPSLASKADSSQRTPLSLPQADIRTQSQQHSQSMLSTSINSIRKTEKSHSAINQPDFYNELQTESKRDTTLLSPSTTERPGNRSSQIPENTTVKTTDFRPTPPHKTEGLRGLVERINNAPKEHKSNRTSGISAHDPVLVPSGVQKRLEEKKIAQALLKTLQTEARKQGIDVRGTEL